MSLLTPQHVSVRPGGSCFSDVVGDITNLGIGSYIESGNNGPAVTAANAFDDNPSTGWNSESPATLASYLGWDWGLAGGDCHAIIRRVNFQQIYNSTNGTKRASAAEFQVSLDGVAWTAIHAFNLDATFPQGDGPIETIDIPSPEICRACRIVPTALTAGGSIPVWAVRHAEFIENIA